MRAFVTGSNGYLGVNLLQELAAEGWDIAALRRTTSDVSDIEKLPGVELVTGDITDIASLRRVLPKAVDAVFHVAGSVGVLGPGRNHTRYDVNQLGTRNVVTVAQERSARRFIHTSTVITYDFRRPGRITEATPRNPDTKDAYAHSKVLAELEVERGMRAGLDAVFLHPSAIFGAYDKETYSRMFLEIERGLPLPAAPPGRTNVCHMRQVARAHIAAFRRGGRGEHYLLGGPEASFFEIATVIAGILGKSPPRFVLPTSVFRLYGRAEHTLSTWLRRRPMLTPSAADTLCYTVLLDSSKAVRELGYEPSSLGVMLRDCYDWMVQSGRLPARSDGRTDA